MPIQAQARTISCTALFHHVRTLSSDSALQQCLMAAPVLVAAETLVRLCQVLTLRRMYRC